MLTKETTNIATDSDIVNCFFERDENAIRMMQNKYGKMFLGIAKDILESVQDAEECLDDLFIRMWKSIPPERPDDLRAYSSKILRNIALDRIRRRNTQKRNHGELIEELTEAVPDTYSDNYADSKQISDAIDAFLRGIDAQARIIFVKRYWFSESLESISDEFGFSIPKVKSSLSRTRAKLRKHLEKEGISI